ncbi:uncharacterized protein CELE_C01G12.9 [Caenorhabditis elegans]|uniref:Uncharacterized protein n=1 Tax=Caenorhabditis elegans TaxID=6239 RepID=Q7YX81_CAEEL|nr:Uncharacterized protein CELE_C01G12.9 [Caenorhabditis elegans]CAE17710.3 Uncharacterized protein CELE_C01G12.9 [Caenorhabditis elegans]|eukprot:NP_001021906.2 Uncharacterized protein CELE_C01G12.9 [Caenorhabditis elegans]
MYRFVLYNVINILVVWITVVSCLKFKKRENKKTLTKPNPITYETDPAVLEKERKQKIAENRSRMRKKREKQLKRQEPDFKELTRKLEQLEMLQEQATQSSKSEKLPAQKNSEIQKAENQRIENMVEMIAKTKTDEKTSTTHSSEEEIGDVQLVDEDPNIAVKKQIVKKRAQELARQRQFEEALQKRKDLEKNDSRSFLQSPDDTLKNVSSIQFESQMSVIQRKKLKNKKKRSSDTLSCDSNDSGTLVKSESNELYI